MLIMLKEDVDLEINSKKYVKNQVLKLAIPEAVEIYGTNISFYAIRTSEDVDFIPVDTVEIIMDN